MKKLILSLLPILILTFAATARADESDELKLIQAAMFMDVPAVKDLLKKGVNPNALQTNRSVLGWAAQSGSLEIVQALVEAKADVNFQDGVGHTALMRAVDMGHEEVAKYLIKAKSNLAAKTPDGVTAVILATRNDQPEILRALLTAGADPNVKTNDEEFPALIAAQDGHLQLLQILAMAKADLNAYNAAYTPLTYAISQDNVELVDGLLKIGASPNGRTKDGRAPLALAFDNQQIMKLLLAAKGDPNYVDGRGDSLLGQAIYDDAVDAVKLLVQNGANVNATDSSGRTLLAYANDMGKEEIATILKDSGAK